MLDRYVLNLIINGLPSIPLEEDIEDNASDVEF